MSKQQSRLANGVSSHVMISRTTRRQPSRVPAVSHSPSARLKSETSVPCLPSNMRPSFNPLGGLVVAFAYVACQTRRLIILHELRMEIFNTVGNRSVLVAVRYVCLRSASSRESRSSEEEQTSPLEPARKRHQSERRGTLLLLSEDEAASSGLISYTASNDLSMLNYFSFRERSFKVAPRERNATGLS